MITAGLGSALLVGLVAGGANASTGEGPERVPFPVATTANPPAGSMMPNFPLGQGRLASQGDFSVKITEIPPTVESGHEFPIMAQTTGFTAGNWVNVWVKGADGSQLDAGGMFTTGDQISIPARLITPGATSVQLSVGSWPAEQWSQSVPINVLNPPSSSKEAEVFHTVTGDPVIVAAYNFAFGGGTREAHFNFATPAGTVTQPIKPHVGRWDVYSTTTPAPGDTAQPGSGVDMTVTALICAPIFLCKETTW